MAAELGRYTYKPGWTFSLRAELFGGNHHLVIETHLPDSRQTHAGRTVRVLRVFQVPPGGFHNATHMAALVLRWVLDMEAHEAHEWFRRDGELVSDPHAQEVHP
jgi:hypothetical protein